MKPKHQIAMNSLACRLLVSLMSVMPLTACSESNAPGNGTKLQATTVIDHMSGDAKVLTVHLYPDKTVFAETSAEYVDERPQHQTDGR
ncbi:hypothetical protein [Burkholderia guangdongensis]|uniref:hypothetical protein n=1 Tax=Burkholderia guangdongensis TaxID=1792500 RepID=UPI0015CEABC4|nr:hypothetical protein [Burkholderia guangdongensis]